MSNSTIGFGSIKFWLLLKCSTIGIPRIASFRLYDENDYEYEIFSIVRSARAWERHFGGKTWLRGRHSTTSFSENVVVAETSFQMLEVLAFCDRERSWPFSVTITVLTFLVKKSTIKNSAVSIFWQYAERLQIKSRTRSRSRISIIYLYSLVLESLL